MRASAPRAFAHAAQAPLLRLPYTKQALSDRLGKTGCAIAAVTDPGLAKAFVSALAQADPEQYSNTAAALAAQTRTDKGRGADKRRAQRQEEETSMSGLIKYRVHEVAKDFNMTSKEITQILTDYATTPKKSYAGAGGRRAQRHL